MNIRDIKKTSTFFFQHDTKHTHFVLNRLSILECTWKKQHEKKAIVPSCTPHTRGWGALENDRFSSLVRLGFKLWAEVLSVAIHGRGDVRQMTALVPQIEFFVLLQKQTPFASVLGRDEGFVVHVKPPLLINCCSGFLHVDTQPEKKA